MRLFFDANVLFSAAYSPEGRAADVIRGAHPHLTVLLTSPYAVLEVQKNMVAKYPAGIQNLNVWLRLFQLVQPMHHDPCPIELPAKDQPIFMAALHGRATHLITGDLKHFGKWMNKPGQTQGILIQTIAHFLDVLH